MAAYKLTFDADEDLANIFRYSILTFGAAQADRYVARLIEGFELLADNPFAGADYAHIRPDSRRLIQEKHVIYYLLEADGSVTIFRILAQHQDPLRHL